ncbi:MAG: S8 family serine peptidase [Gemmatimonadales bacterium]|nr:S8 family serine peptidase [Gemmatimonadales bacterium]
MTRLFRFSAVSLLVLLISILVTFGTGIGTGFGSESGVAPMLERALGSSDFPRLEADGRLAVWVFFRDRNLTELELNQALQDAEAQLSERTARRRAKMVSDGQSLVDGSDLPVCRDYLDRILAKGATLRRTSRWLNAASFEMSREQIRDVAALDFVEKVDLVARFKRPDIPTPVVIPDAAQDKIADEKTAAWTIDYGTNLAAMEQVNVPLVHEMGLTGAGVVIGMLDTGFHPTHECLADVPVLGAYDFVNDDTNVDFEEGDPSSSINHGTMTMSTATGNMPGQLVAPAFGASVVLGKTEDVSQEIPIEEDNWVAGLEWAEAQGADIISSSLGYYDWYTFEDMDGETAVTTIAGDLGAGRGLVIVNSAGNERGSLWGHLIAPADGDSIFTIGAVDSAGAVTYFSSPGPTYDGRIKPDVSALGYSNTVANPYDDFTYTSASGTSFSCPLVSGVVALVLQRAPSLTPMEVREALCMTASQADNPDNDLGWGIVDAYAAVHYFGPKFIHAPLDYSQDVTGPYLVSAQITDRVGVDPAQVALYYRLDGGSWNSLLMTDAEGDNYSADIPGQPDDTLVEYYLEAVSTNGVITHDPDSGGPGAPGNYHDFLVSSPSPVSLNGQDGLPNVTSLAAAVPNPFNPRTLVSFTLAAPGPVRLDVFNLKGQLVRTLVDSHLEAGPHAEVWNGCDVTGLEVGSGVYLYRLETGEGVLEGKMLLVR